MTELEHCNNLEFKQRVANRFYPVATLETEKAMILCVEIICYDDNADDDDCYRCCCCLQFSPVYVAFVENKKMMTSFVIRQSATATVTGNSNNVNLK